MTERDQWIETAARAIYERVGQKWEWVPKGREKCARLDATAALDAVLPQIEATWQFKVDALNGALSVVQRERDEARAQVLAEVQATIAAAARCYGGPDLISAEALSERVREIGASS